MSLVGQSANVAAILASLVDEIFTSSSSNSDSPSPPSDSSSSALAKHLNIGGETPKQHKEFHLELEDGKKFSLLSKHVLRHKDDQTRSGRSFSIGKTATGMSDALYGQEVVFTVAADDSGNLGVFAINTFTSADYIVTFSTTNGAGGSTLSIYYLPRASNFYKPYWLEVTQPFSQYKSGNVVLTPAALAPLLSVDPTPTLSVLSNYLIPNIITGESYMLYFNKDAGSVSLTWVNDPATFLINGASVTNNTQVDVGVTIHVVWENPAQSFTVNAAATANKTTTVTFPTSINRPIANASIATTQAADDVKAQLLFRQGFEQQVKEGKVKAVKYAYM